MISDTQHLGGTNLKKKHTYPMVSIGIPTFNGSKRIASAVTSVMNQRYPNLEVIISDNCSSDNTEAVCADLCRKYNTVHYYRQKENIGIIPNFEFALNQAKGDLFMWIADDDLLEAGILNKYVQFLIAHPDYSLVAGEIQYWTGDKPEFLEKDFSMEHNSRDIRVIQYYSKVKHGATFYGMMPLEIARQITLQNRMGEDWHFVAKAAYLGKIKMLNCLGYHKKLNGSSKTLRQYAKMIGASAFTASFPHLRIALDAFSEIMTSAIFDGKQFISRLTLALSSCASVLFNHYFTEYPFIIGGKFLRLIGIKRFHH
jgi:glycosyltransferase involved in cell wall biosynthesis